MIAHAGHETTEHRILDLGAKYNNAGQVAFVVSDAQGAERFMHGHRVPDVVTMGD